MTLSIMTLGIMTLVLSAFSIMTLVLTSLSIALNMKDTVKYNADHCNYFQ
jgi:hypothetical protein